MAGSLTSRTAKVRWADLPDPSPSRPLAVDLVEAERLTSLSRYTLRRYIKRGWLRATHCNRRLVIPLSELERLVQEGVPPRREDGSACRDVSHPVSRTGTEENSGSRG